MLTLTALWSGRMVTQQSRRCMSGSSRPAMPRRSASVCKPGARGGRIALPAVPLSPASPASPTGSGWRGGDAARDVRRGRRAQVQGLQQALEGHQLARIDLAFEGQVLQVELALLVLDAARKQGGFRRARRIDAQVDDRNRPGLVGARDRAVAGVLAQYLPGPVHTAQQQPKWKILFKSKRFKAKKRF